MKDMYRKNKAFPWLGDIASYVTNETMMTHIISIIIITVIKDVAGSILKFLLKPIMNIDINNDGTPDRKTLENLSFTVLGMKFEIGKLIFKLIETAFIIFLGFHGSKAVQAWLPEEKK
jgi:hypothetical protein